MRKNKVPYILEECKNKSSDLGSLSVIAEDRGYGLQEELLIRCNHIENAILTIRDNLKVIKANLDRIK